MSISKRELDKIIRDAQAVSQVSLNRKWFESDNFIQAEDLDNSESPKSSDSVQRAHLRDLKSLISKGFSRTESLIITLYYYEGMTMKEIGAKLGLSESRVSQIHSSILERFKDQLVDRKKSEVILTFFHPGPLNGELLELKLITTNPADRSKGYVPEYVFDVVLTNSAERVGQAKLRIGSEEEVRWAGHVHFSIEPEHRGHKYSVKASRLLFPLAKRHGINRIWFSCNAKNQPSRSILDTLGATLAETIPTPENSDIYAEGERRTCRYLLDI